MFSKKETSKQKCFNTVFVLVGECRGLKKVYQKYRINTYKIFSKVSFVF